MVSKEVLIKNASGLESKQIAMFIQKASNYKSSLWVEKGERKANAKSLLGLLSLGIGNGAKIIISAEGEDETNAINELARFLNSILEESVNI
jgi:phosphocarrier protein HPr